MFPTGPKATFSLMGVGSLAHKPLNRKDWAQKVGNGHKTADFRPVCFNDCTALLEAITFEPFNQFSQYFLIWGQGDNISHLYYHHNVQML